jgi:nicotinate dehydrogenase subunit B
MDRLDRNIVSRRTVLTGAGALVVSFSMLSRGLAQQTVQPVPQPMPSAEPATLPGSLNDTRFLDAWIRIDASGKITVFTGKAELGQGIRTALRQVAAEELWVEPDDIVLVTADTGLTPDEGFTAGSQSMPNSGTAIRHAAAQCREILLTEAGLRFGVEPQSLKAYAKTITDASGAKVTYGELVASSLFHVEAKPASILTPHDKFRVMGKPAQRIDIPAKVTGGEAYVQDLRLRGMLHARVVRPPSYGARLKSLDPKSVESMPGVVSVIQDGNFIAVVAEKEFRAVNAMWALAAAAKWTESETLPDQFDLVKVLQGLETQVGTVAESGKPPAANSGKVFEAVFTRPYMMHGSIGPSCAIAHMQDDKLTVYSHTQGVFPDREAIAEMLAMPQANVRVIHAEGAGCYGHNGADDAAADAALIASKIPGRPIRVQWMRHQEHAWEPYGPAMVMKLRATLDQNGKVASWNYNLWSNTHSTRPGGAGALIAGGHKQQGFQLSKPELRISPAGNGDRNADPLYVFGSKRVLWHFLPEMPLRVSALRALGAYANVFALESAMDELAIMAGTDSVEFRLRHLEDERARDVIKLAAEKFNWNGIDTPSGNGKGLAFARYKNLAAYLAVAAKVRVDRTTGRILVNQVTAAIDSGEVVNPDGIRNQTEGGIMQSMSWTLFEQVTFDRTRITSTDWSSYPILRFASVPERVDVHIIDRPGEPFLGTGEAAQGPVCAAISNAVRNAIGKRLFDLPLTRERVLNALLT